MQVIIASVNTTYLPVIAAWDDHCSSGTSAQSLLCFAVYWNWLTKVKVDTTYLSPRLHCYKSCVPQTCRQVFKGYQQQSATAVHTGKQHDFWAKPYLSNNEQQQKWESNQWQKQQQWIQNNWMRFTDALRTLSTMLTILLSPSTCRSSFMERNTLSNRSTLRELMPPPPWLWDWPAHSLGLRNRV